jgi:hypothetical protein
MSNEKEAGFEELEFDLTKVGESTQTETTKDIVVDDVEPTPQPEKKKVGKEKKVEPVDDILEPEPEPKKTSKKQPDPEPEPEEELNLEGEGSESTLFETLAEKLGYQFDEDETYEETEDGLAQFITNASDKVADAKLNGYFESLPPIAGEFFDYLQMLGDDATEENIKQFFTTANPEVDFSTIDLKDESVQKSVMRTLYREMDYTDEEIKESLEDLEISGTLAKQAQIAAGKLTKMQDRQRAVLLEQQRAADIQRRQQLQRFWGEVDTTIKKGRVQNFNIPTTEQRAIMDYMSRPTKNNASQMQEDLKNLSVEDRVALAIFLKNKGNLNKYISTAAASQKASTLRDKLKGVTPKMKSGGGYSSSAEDDIDFSIK